MIIIIDNFNKILINIFYRIDNWCKKVDLLTYVSYILEFIASALTIEGFILTVLILNQARTMHEDLFSARIYLKSEIIRITLMLAGAAFLIFFLWFSIHIMQKHSLIWSAEAIAQVEPVISETLLAGFLAWTDIALWNFYKIIKVESPALKHQKKANEAI